MSDISKKQEAVTLRLIEKFMMGDKEAARNALGELVENRIAAQIQKVGKEKLI